MTLLRPGYWPFWMSPRNQVRIHYRKRSPPGEVHSPDATTRGRPSSMIRRGSTRDAQTVFFSCDSTPWHSRGASTKFTPWPWNTGSSKRRKAATSVSGASWNERFRPASRPSHRPRKQPRVGDEGWCQVAGYSTSEAARTVSFSDRERRSCFHRDREGRRGTSRSRGSPGDLRSSPHRLRHRLHARRLPARQTRP
jgi:hypothetical protein